MMVGPMNSKKRLEHEKIQEFLKETQKDSPNTSENSQETHAKRPETLSKPFQCPSCHQSLSSRKEPCKHCGYKGYIPLSDDQIKRTRLVLFIVLSIIAIAVFILTR